jgi:hypothetical protein
MQQASGVWPSQLLMDSHIYEAARAARDFLTVSYDFKLIFEAKTLHLRQVFKTPHSLVDQDMISTQPGSAQPHLSCAYVHVCAVVLSCRLCLTMQHVRPPENSAEGHFCFYGCSVAALRPQTQGQHASSAPLASCMVRARLQPMLRHSRRACTMTALVELLGSL